MSAACPVYGFVIHLPASTGDPESVIRVMERELLASRGLAILAAANRDIIVAGDGCQATHADHEAAVAWLRSRQDLAQATVSPLGDVGHAA